MIGQAGHPCGALTCRQLDRQHKASAKMGYRQVLLEREVITRGHLPVAVGVEDRVVDRQRPLELPWRAFVC